MRVKKYRANSMPEAMSLIKADLGPDAVILHSVKRKPGGLLGFLRSPVLEVTAAVDTDLKDFPEPTPAISSEIERLKSDLAAVKITLNKVSETRKNAAATQTRGKIPQSGRPTARGANPGAATVISAYKNGNSEHTVLEPKREIVPVDSLENWYKHLRDQGVGLDVAQHIVKAVGDELNRWALDNTSVLNEHLHWHLGRNLKRAKPLSLVKGQPHVFFIVGPTGVGKTTTLAKLAAHFSRGKKAKVMMITSDTFRVAAIPQISTYGDILNVPVEVAYSPEQLTEIIQENQHHDLILVDTPGRNQNDVAEVDELSRYITAIPSKTVHLAVTAGTKYEDMRQIIQSFGSMPLDGLIFTKADETLSFGPAYTLAIETGLPLSYITNGQRVPEDIQVASAERVIDLLVGSVPDQIRSINQLNLSQQVRQ